MTSLKQKKNRKNVVLISGVLFASLVILQATSPKVTNPPVGGAFQGPKEITRIFKRACYDCHSNETKLSWFDKIVPFSYVVAADVKEARSRYNFSLWDSISKGDQEVKLWYMVNMINAGKMPLRNYTLVHSGSRVSAYELNLLKNYVIKLSRENHRGDTTKIKSASPLAEHNRRVGSKKVPRSINGISYFDDYKNWKVLSSTNRLDNGTMRLNYANDIAIKAIRENTINPWPNGAIIVKVVWNMQPEDKQGIVRPGNFNNVQVMIRDDKKFKDTEGWGFARFNGLDLEPYGNTISFATSCINCHRLVTDHGFVFDIPAKDLNVKSNQE